MEITCNLGVWNTAVQPPPEWDRWCGQSVADDADGRAKLELKVATAMRSPYVGVLVCGGEGLRDNFVCVLSGETPFDLLCDAIVEVEDACSEFETGGCDTMFVEFERWSHDLARLEEARTSIDEMMLQDGVGQVVTSTVN